MLIAKKRWKNWQIQQQSQTKAVAKSQLTESSPVRVVQGSMSQHPEEFSESNREKLCTRNGFTFILHHATSIGESIKKLVIDAVFKVGDRLHTVLWSALSIVGQRLSFEELQTTIKQIGISHCFTFPDGIITGDIFSKASCLPFVTLEKGLRSTLLSNAGSLEYNVAVKKLPYALHCLIHMQWSPKALWLAEAKQYYWSS